MRHRESITRCTGNGGRTRSAALGVAAAVALSLLTIEAGKAFLPGSLMRQLPSTVSMQLGAETSVRGRGPGVSAVDSPGARWQRGANRVVVKCLACVALLGITAARASSRRATSKRSSSCRIGTSPMSMCALQGFAQLTAPPRAIVAPGPPLLQLQRGEFLDLGKSESRSAAAVLVPEPVAVCPTASPEAPASFPSSAVFLASPPGLWASMRARCARRVGGARRADRRSASTSRSAASRAARRAVGARLCGVPAVPSAVQKRSFDPSTLRRKIQTGLQTSSRRRSESGREAKTPAATKGSDMSTLVGIQANYFVALKGKTKMRGNNCDPSASGAILVEGVPCTHLRGLLSVSRDDSIWTRLLRWYAIAARELRGISCG